MTTSETPARPSAAEEARARRRRRRAAKLQMRDVCFELLTAGLTQQEIAKARGVSVATVRREIDRAIAERPVRAPGAHVRLQIARATKALVMLDGRIGEGQTSAVGPYLRTLAALDRYHGFEAPTAPVVTARAEPQRLPAPPLALTHAASPLDPVPGEAAEVAGDDA